jgi:hypothetical protein
VDDEDRAGDYSHPLFPLAEIFVRYGDRFRANSYIAPEKGSARELDNQRIAGELTPGFIASQKMTFAYDALRAVALLWQSGAVHFVADYALFRTAVECSVQAWWVLAPDVSEERVRRAVRIMMDDLVRARSRENTAVKIALSEESRDKRNAVVDNINKHITNLERAFDDTGIAWAEGIRRHSQLDMLNLLQEAQESIEKIPDVGLTLLWSMLSSLAHGSPSSVNQLSSTNGRMELPDRVAYLTNDADTVLQFATSTFQLVDVVDGLWWSYSDVGHPS